MVRTSAGGERTHRKCYLPQQAQQSPAQGLAAQGNWMVGGPLQWLRARGVTQAEGPAFGSQLRPNDLWQITFLSEHQLSQK